MNCYSKEIFYEKNIKLQKSIIKEIENVHKGLSNKSINQLETILIELKKIEKGENIILAYPRFIIDTWDFEDLLAYELMELFEIYKKISIKK